VTKQWQQQKQQVPNNVIIMSPKEVWVVWREILLLVMCNPVDCEKKKRRRRAEKKVVNLTDNHVLAGHA